MKTAISIPNVVLKNAGPLQLTHRKTNGWKSLGPHRPKDYLAQAEKIIYLGKCHQDGDMFALYHHHGYIMIFKGNLNSGTY